jgi:hypothetical protein
MAKPENAPAPQVDITVKAYTKNPKDEGYYHSFEQNETFSLTFEVKIDPPVDSINFVVWNIYDPANPKVAVPSTDYSGKSGKVIITIGPHFIHLGPGPYCATLTASNPTAVSAGGRETVGNVLYYYETWPRRIY